MDKIQMQDKARFYLNLFEQVRTVVADTSLAMAIFQEIARDIRQERAEDRARFDGNSPATDRQLDYLKKLAVPIPENPTKKEASRLIDEANGNDGSGSARNADRGEEAPAQWHRKIP